MTLARVIIDLAPEFIVLVASCAVLLLGAWRATTVWCAPFSVAATLLALGTALYLGSAPDTHPLPGIWLNSLTFYVRAITLSIGAVILLLNWHQSVLAERGEFLSLILSSLLGVMLTAASDDLVVLFLAVELVSIPTYVLIALSRIHARASEAAVKYFFLGALSAAIIAYGIALLYGGLGDTSFAALRTVDFAGGSSNTAMLGLMLLFAGICFKIAAVPFHVYAPDVYQGAASPVAGILGFVPKFAGFIVLIKVFSAFDWDLPRELQWMLWGIAAVTMTIGNVLALWQKNIKRTLAYSSIAHTGYMMIPLLVGPALGQGPLRDGVAAILFYISVYGLMNLGAFAVLSCVRSGDEEVETFDELAGLSKGNPVAALALAVCTLSLMGLPPTAGFLAKFYVFGAAFSLRPDHPMHMPLIILAIIGVINTAISAAYYLRIVATAYMSPQTSTLSRWGGAPLRVGLALCALPMLILFALPNALTRQTQLAGRALRTESNHRLTRAQHAAPSEVARTQP